MTRIGGVQGVVALVMVAAKTLSPSLGAGELSIYYSFDEFVRKS
jgi:hypothetical protein